MFALRNNNPIMSHQQKAEELILSIQREINDKIWIETRGSCDERCYFMAQDTQMAAKEIAINSIKREREAVKNCFLKYSDLQRFDKATAYDEYEGLLAALEAFEAKSDEIK